MRNRGGVTPDGRYDVHEAIGHGGYGTVYRAVVRSIQRNVAIKYLNEAFVEHVTIRERFRREAFNPSRITHRNVVQILDFDGDSVPPYIVMEYVDGTDLRRLLPLMSDWSVERRVHFFCEVLDGLGAIHEEGIVHRDIKPENVLVEDGSGTPKITDFGIAQARRDARLTRTGEVPGTPAYMAPERWTGDLDRVDYSSDIYSASVILYEMLTGTVPFKGDDVGVVHERLTREPLPIRALNPEIPEELERATLKGLEMDPDDRYQSAANMKDELLDALRRSASPVVTPTQRTREMAGANALPYAEPNGGGRGRSRPVFAALPFVVAILVLALLQLSQLDGNPELTTADDADDTPRETQQPIADDVPNDGVEQVSQPLESRELTATSSGCPAVTEVEQRAGVDLRPINEYCGFATSQAASPAPARCPEGFICTFALQDDRVVVATGELQVQDAIVGTWRHVSSYPTSDAVHSPCQLLRKERTNTPLPVAAYGFTCSET